MRHVTSVNDESRFFRHTGDMVQCVLECAGNVRIDRLVEPQMTVAHLGERKADFSCLGLADHMGPGNTAGHRPEHRAASPRHAFKKSAAVRVEEFSGHGHAPSLSGPSGPIYEHNPPSSVFIPDCIGRCIHQPKVGRNEGGPGLTTRLTVIFLSAPILNVGATLEWALR